MPDSIDSHDITLCILAGGEGQRVNQQDKGLLEWQGKPLVEHILHDMSGQFSHIVINANRNQELYEHYGYDVIRDDSPGFQGPLMGILSLFKHTTTPYILVIPCDSPHPPQNLLSRLTQCLLEKHTPCALCHDGERLQPLFALLSREIENQLDRFVAQDRHKVQDFFESINQAICDFSDQPQAFTNINTLEDFI